MTRSEAVEKIGQRLAIPIQSAGRLAADEDDKIAEEFSGVSCGTALACVLRPLGYGLVPRATAEGLAYGVGKARWTKRFGRSAGRRKNRWPDNAGAVRVPQRQRAERDGGEGVGGDRGAVEGPRADGLQCDGPARRRSGEDARFAPPARTTYSLALRKLLFQAGLKFEVRLDEAGKPFLWITTVKPCDGDTPMSPLGFARVSLPFTSLTKLLYEPAPPTIASIAEKGGRRKRASRWRSPASLGKLEILGQKEVCSFAEGVLHGVGMVLSDCGRGTRSVVRPAGQGDGGPGTFASRRCLRRGSDGPWLPAGRVKGLFPADQPAAETPAAPAAARPRPRASRPRRRLRSRCPSRNNRPQPSRR